MHSNRRVLSILTFFSIFPFSLNVLGGETTEADYRALTAGSMEEKEARIKNRDQFLAREHARISLSNIKQWVSGGGALSNDVESCSSQAFSPGVFSPGFEAPKADELLQLCDVIAIGLNNVGPQFKSHCEVLEYSPCRIELSKRVEFVAEAWFNPVHLVVIGERDPYPMKVATQVHGTVVYRCEPVAVLDIMPKWICGSGEYEFATYVDGHSYTTEKGWAQFLFADETGALEAIDTYSELFAGAISTEQTKNVSTLLKLPN